MISVSVRITPRHAGKINARWPRAKRSRGGRPHGWTSALDRAADSLNPACSGTLSHRLASPVRRKASTIRRRWRFRTTGAFSRRAQNARLVIDAIRISSDEARERTPAMERAVNVASGCGKGLRMGCKRFGWHACAGSGLRSSGSARSLLHGLAAHFRPDATALRARESPYRARTTRRLQTRRPAASTAAQSRNGDDGEAPCTASKT